MSRLLLVAEGPSDLRRVRLLLDARQPGRHEVVGLTDDEPFLKRSALSELARAHRIRVSERGLVGQLRKALLLVRALERRWDKVIVLVDSDGAAVAFGGSLDGLLEGVAVGVAHECGEAWVVEGHEASTELRERLRRSLGFDPFAHPERLSHKEVHPKSAKRLVADLALDEASCLQRLATHGGSSQTGSREFLLALEALLSGA